MHSPETAHTCKNCGNIFNGNYCNECGEKVYTEHDKTVLHFFEDAVHFLTHFDSGFLNNIKTIFTKPGKFSFDYCEGKRKKYLKPLSFFMVLVVLYLIFPMATGLNMPFDFYLRDKNYAQKLLEHRTGVKVDSLYNEIFKASGKINFSSPQAKYVYQVSYADSILHRYPKIVSLEKNYDHLSEKTSKILLLVIIPLTALALYAVSFYKRRYFFDHLVMATELNSFFVMFDFLITPLIIKFAVIVAPGIITHFSDEDVGILLYVIFAVFSSIAFRLFYNEAWYLSIPKAIFIAYIHSQIIQVVYKFLLFTVTLYLSK
ncbi:MAG: DUF3667 domain-containing protein [Parafilimonas sp.]|nr:DUF3667 domain-containing protein [Parafilimonas sp.]